MAQFKIETEGFAELGLAKISWNDTGTTENRIVDEPVSIKYEFDPFNLPTNPIWQMNKNGAGFIDHTPVVANPEIFNFAFGEYQVRIKFTNIYQNAIGYSNVIQYSVV